MSDQADVKSIDSLAFVKAAFAAFAHETNQAVSEIEIQGQRAVEWITVDRAAFWKAEIRRRSDIVNKAIKDLEHCRTFKRWATTRPRASRKRRPSTRRGSCWKWPSGRLRPSAAGRRSCSSSFVRRA